MQIRSADPLRSRSIDESDDASGATPTREASVDRPAPDWDRIPTLDPGTLAAIESGSADKELAPKLERLRTDLVALHDALAPYARECKEVLHGFHEIEEAIHLVEHAKDVGMFGPAVVAFAIAKAKHGVESIRHGLDGMLREAPEAARKAQPLLTKVLDDLVAIKGALAPATAAIERPVVLAG